MQAVAIRGRFQHLVVKVGEPPERQAQGTLIFMVGTATELRDRIDGLPPEVASRAWVGFAYDRRSGGSVLVASGPGQVDVETAVEALAGPTERPAGVPRTEVDTIAWRAPDAPLITGERAVRLSNLDIGTQEFSGRRFRTEFSLALPADFYAEFYGEAVLYLDAAYAQMVKPGSHFDVYVNGRITATLALNGARGGIYQRFPLKLLLRNFKAGVNDVVIESVLLTDSDQQCLPGGTLPGPNRFVLFDTTEIKFPEYARIGRSPDLNALTASGFPYVASQGPVALILGRHDAPHYGAAATLVAKLAHSAGRPLRYDTNAQFLSIAERRAIFVGTAGELPPSILPSVGLANTARTAWPNSVEIPIAGGAAGPTEGQQTYDAVLDRFRERQAGAAAAAVAEEPMSATGTEEIRDRWRRSLGGGALRREFTSVEDWMKRTFEILVLGVQSVLRSAAAVRAAAADLGDPRAGPQSARARLVDGGGRPQRGGAHGWSRGGGRRARVAQFDGSAHRLSTVDPAGRQPRGARGHIHRDAPVFDHQLAADFCELAFGEHDLLRGRPARALHGTRHRHLVHAEGARAAMRRAAKKTALIASLATAFAVSTARAEPWQEPRSGSLSAEMWGTYKARFVRGEGRVVDDANGDISHSEWPGLWPPPRLSRRRSHRLRVDLELHPRRAADPRRRPRRLALGSGLDAAGHRHQQRHRRRYPDRLFPRPRRDGLAHAGLRGGRAGDRQGRRGARPRASQRSGRCCCPASPASRRASAPTARWSIRPTGCSRPFRC